jgi:hypothetical protein
MGHDGEAAMWQRLIGRIEQLRQSTHGLITDFPTAVPEWPFDKARVLKVALMEAESAIKRAECAATGAVELARMADRLA